jgi:hypothetical protein
MSWIAILKVAHIAGGFLGLVIAPVAMWAYKYGRAHRTAGYAYVAAMLLAVSTSLVLAYVRSSLFLFLIGLFSGYLSISGLSTVRRRGARGTWFDWGLLGVFGVTGAAMVTVGLGVGFRASGDGTGMVLLVFGSLAVVIAARDGRLLPRVVGPSEWVPKHLSAMCASYLASVSAFSATQLVFLHSTAARFLWPTAVGVPLVVWASIKWKRKLSRLRTDGAPVAVS